MGNTTPQPDARSLRAELEGLSIDNARFATDEEIASYLSLRGFQPTGKDGEYTDGSYLISDARPKNVLVSESGATFVIDADVSMI